MHSSRCINGLIAGIALACLSVAPRSGAADRPPAERDLFDQAAALYQQQDWSAALRALDALAAVDGEASRALDARFFAAECLVQLGDFATASRRLESMWASPDRDLYPATLLYRCGEAARLMGDGKLARRRLEQFVAEQPHDRYAIYARLQLAEFAKKDGDLEGAADHYRQALELDSLASPPADRSWQAQARLNLAHTLIALGQTDAATATLEPLLTLPYDAPAENEAADYAHALLMSGQAHYRGADYKSAWREFDRLIRSYPQAEATPRARLAAGWALWKLNRLTEADQVVMPLRDNPSLATDVAALRGMIAYSAGDFAKATRRLTRDDARATPDWQLFYAGESARRAGQTATARRHLQQAAQRPAPNPWADDALWSLAHLAAAEGDRPAATAWMAKLAEQHPESPYAHDDWQSAPPAAAQLLWEAYSLQRDSRPEAALAALIELTNTPLLDDQLRGEALWQAGTLHAQLGQHVDARRKLEALLDDSPEHPQAAAAQLALATLAADNGDLAAASTHFTQTAEQFPQTFEALEAAYWLATHAADEKRSDDARRWAEAVIVDGSQADHGRQSDGDLLRRTQLQRRAEFLLARIDIDGRDWASAHRRLRALERATDLENLTLPVEFWAAECEFRLGRAGDAEQHFLSLARRTANSREAWAGMPLLRLAQLHARKQRWLEVLEILEELNTRHPQFDLQGEAAYLRGRALAGRGEMRRARLAYGEVLADPQSEGAETAAMAQWMIGETFFHQRNFERARRAYQQVLDEHEHRAWQTRAALQIGKCWELEARWEHAAEVYAQALTTAGDDDLEAQLSARLQWVERHTRVRR